MQMDEKATNTDLNGQENLPVRKPYQSPILKPMGAIQEVLHANCGLGHDSHSSAS